MSNTQFTILVVDDNAENVDMLARRLEKLGHKVVTVANGESALCVLEEQAVDLVLLDILMPDIDGYEVLRRIRSDRMHLGVPVIMLSALDNMSSIVKCTELGADAYLPKPYSQNLLQATIRNCLERKRMLDQERDRYLKLREITIAQDEEINRVQSEAITREVEKACQGDDQSLFDLSRLAQYREIGIENHLERIRNYCQVLAEALAEMEPFKEKLTEEFIEKIFLASPLYDIGKVGIADSIMNKPSKLSTYEQEVMQTHTSISVDIIKDIMREHEDGELREIALHMAEHHHERYDGSGYPKGISGDNIPLVAGIIGFVDVYDAMTSPRCYKPPQNGQTIETTIREMSATHFHPAIIKAYFTVADRFREITQRFKDEDLGNTGLEEII